MPAEGEKHVGDGGVETQEQRDASSVATDGDHLVELYKKMVLIRAFEEACQRAFRQGKIGGYLHVYIGQEAVATGFLDAFKEGDRAITAYRDHAHALLWHRPQRGHGRALRQGHGDGQGQGRLDAPLRRRAGPMGGYGIVGGTYPWASASPTR
jgi:pyruvate dehydrogenase E1 component alpha subunit